MRKSHNRKEIWKEWADVYQHILATFWSAHRERSCEQEFEVIPSNVMADDICSTSSSTSSKAVMSSYSIRQSNPQTLFSKWVPQYMCRIWDSHSGCYEGLHLLGCNIMHFVESQATFRKKMSLPFSGSNSKPCRKPAWNKQQGAAYCGSLVITSFIKIVNCIN
jgi:hypothetical protein